MLKTRLQKKILYISYDGIMEPLGYSQVLKYLESLSQDFNITLISFEKNNVANGIKDFHEIRQHCLKKNINWQPKKYHQGFGMFSHMLNILNIFFAPIIEMIKNNHGVIHIRSYMPGLAIPVLKMFFDFKFVFDIRGFWADEKVDRLGWAKSSFKYRFFKKLETNLFQNADEVVTLTEASKEFIANNFTNAPESIHVISTCVDLAEFNIHGNSLQNLDADKKLVIGYLGSIDTAYDFKTFLNLIKSLEKRAVKIDLKILSNTTPAVVKQYLKQKNLEHLEFELLFLKRNELSMKINQFDLLGFALKPSFSLIASMPTKIAESLACGTPIICNNFNKDIEDIISSNKVGILTDFSLELSQRKFEDIISIVKDKNTPKRCSDFSKNYFSLNLGISKYHKIYSNLL